MPIGKLPFKVASNQRQAIKCFPNKFLSLIFTFGCKAMRLGKKWVK